MLGSIVLHLVVPLFLILHAYSLQLKILKGSRTAIFRLFRDRTRQTKVALHLVVTFPFHFSCTLPEVDNQEKSWRISGLPRVFRTAMSLSSRQRGID
jgi:hypothetical protein